MKTRNGFVSNSSSSSFIIIGKLLDENDIKKIISHFNLKDEEEFFSDFIYSCEEIQFVHNGEENETYAGDVICDSSDGINDFVFPLVKIIEGPEIKKLKEIIGEFEIHLCAGNYPC
jgi:hypothetical protein